MRGDKKRKMRRKGAKNAKVRKEIEAEKENVIFFVSFAPSWFTIQNERR